MQATLATLFLLAHTTVNGKDVAVQSARGSAKSSEVNQHGNVMIRHQAGEAGMMRREDKLKIARPGASLADSKEAALQQRMVQARRAMSSPDEAPPQLDPSLSAYEIDIHNPEESEYFGPFRIDYHDHTINLEDWNMVVESPREQPGRGNLVVGTQNFIADATNSAVFGKHDTARGLSEAVMGFDNVAEGEANSLIGGQNGVAKGNSTAVTGGYGNEAIGNFASNTGGTKGVAEGDFAVVAGGDSNLADGKDSVVTGGNSNEALGPQSATHGGSGNKVTGKVATISSGLGQSAENEAEVKNQETFSETAITNDQSDADAE